MGPDHIPRQNFRLSSLVFLLLIFSSTANAGPPKCFLHGLIVPTEASDQKPSVSDMIRLHFDAKEKKKCEVMISSYCQFNVREKDYSPTKLKGIFKPDVDKETEFTYGLTPKCKLITDED